MYTLLQFGFEVVFERDHARTNRLTVYHVVANKVKNHTQVLLKFRLSWQIFLIRLIFLPNWNKNCDAKWSPILVSAWAWLLNFTDLTIHSHCCHFWVMLVLCKCLPCEQWILTFSQRDNRIQQFNASIIAWANNEGQWRWMVRLLKLNNQTQAKMGDHLVSTIFFSLVEKIRQINQFNQNFKNPQLGLEGLSLKMFSCNTQEFNQTGFHPRQVVFRLQ